MKFLRVYLFIALWFGCIGVLDSLLNFLISTTVGYQNIIAIVSAAFLLLNLVAFPIFIYQKLEMITYVLPIYHLISFVIISLIGTWLSFLSIFPFWFYLILSFVLSVAEVLFSLFMLRKYDFI